MPRFPRSLSVSLAALCLGAWGAAAQEIEEAEEDPVAIILPEISITATRSPIAAFEYPGMVSVVGRDEIETMQPSSPDDILKWIPGVESVGGPRRIGEVPTIRGFSGPDVVVLIDGARQNFNAGHDGRYFIDPSMVESVEVLRGPASSLYGSGGTGGVIEYRTLEAADFLDPGETAGFRVGTGYQTAFHEIVGTATGFARPTDDIDMIASITGRDSGSIELGNGTELDRTDDDIFAALLKSSWQFATFQELSAGINHYEDNAEEPNNGQGAGGNDIVNKKINTTTFTLGYDWDDPGNPWIDLDVGLYYTMTDDTGLRLDANGTGNAGEQFSRTVDTTGLRVDNRSSFMLGEDAGLTLTYGVEAYRDIQDGDQAGFNRDGVPDATANFAGTFVQGEFDIAEPLGFVPGRLLLLPGLRYDDYKTTSDVAADNSNDHVSPRFGASYLPTDWLMVFGNYAQAFRAPTFDELYLSGVHFRIPIGPGITNRFIANPDLQPQVTTTKEFGVGLTFDNLTEPGDLFQFKMSRAFIDGSNFIDLNVTQPSPFVNCNPFIPGNCDGTTQAVNVADARLWSTEAEASYENSRFILNAGYSQIDGKDLATGNRLGVLTPNELLLGAAVKLPEFDALVGWRMTGAWAFDKVNTPADERGGYAVQDFYAAWQPGGDLFEGLRIDLGVDNAFDKAYSRVATDTYEAGRNWKAGASYTFTW